MLVKSNVIFKLNLIFRINGEEPKYLLFPHLLSEEEELEYLRKVSEVFILFFMPQGYTYSPTNCFLREVFTCKGNFYFN